MPIPVCPVERCLTQVPFGGMGENDSGFVQGVQSVRCRSLHPGAIRAASLYLFSTLLKIVSSAI